MTLKYTETFLHGIGFRNGKKYALICRLGGMQVGVMWFPWTKDHEKKRKCEGCLQGKPFWNKPIKIPKNEEMFGID